MRVEIRGTEPDTIRAGTNMAATDLLSGPVTYEAAIWEPIGLRSQARLNSDQATEVASCLLVRRDVSPNL